MGWQIQIDSFDMKINHIVITFERQAQILSSFTANRSRSIFYSVDYDLQCLTMLHKNEIGSVPCFSLLTFKYCNC